MAGICYITIFLSAFNIRIKKANDNKLLKNIVLILLVRYIIVIYLQKKDIIFDYFLQSFGVPLALRIYKRLMDFYILFINLYIRLWVFWKIIINKSIVLMKYCSF